MESSGCVDLLPELEIEAGVRLRALSATIATAESCSGGLIAHRLTNVAGASDYFLGGVVAYSNEAKVAFLGVTPEALASHGAVSEPVARQMAEGARAHFKADFGIGVTGIAGPSGGTAEKPVGLVYIAVAGVGGTRVTRNVFPGDRVSVKAQTAGKALEMLLECLA
jgi:PncC family amidohydrolase